MQQHDGNLLMLHTCSINLFQRGRVSDIFKILFGQKTCFCHRLSRKYKIKQYAYCNLSFFYLNIHTPTEIQNFDPPKVSLTYVSTKFQSVPHGFQTFYTNSLVDFNFFVKLCRNYLITLQIHNLPRDWFTKQVNRCAIEISRTGQKII